jgi:Fe-S-cluster-containing dehydrogenase component
MNKGLKPACVSACAAEALKIVDMEGPLPGNCKKTIPSFAFIPLTNPSVRFLLPRETMCFWLKEKEVQG